jgi:DNA-binding transcriptional LysR family regulator
LAEEAPMIELRHLRYFVVVAEELNFRRAAERVHIDQTPLSRAIRDLEDRLGLQLFVRAPRKLHLTPAGLRLLKEARKVFIRIDRAYRAVRETDARFRAPLRIGIADGIAQPRLSECLIRWRKSMPEVPLELMELRAAELANALEREEIDAGFSFGLPDNDAIAQQPAWSYPVMAILPTGHELASQTVLSLAELLAFPLLSCHAERQPGLLHQMRTIVRRHTTNPTLAGEARTLTGYVTRIAAGLAVGLGDAGHVATLCRSDVLAVPLREDERITTFVLHKHQRFGLPDALHRFVAHARTVQ